MSTTHIRTSGGLISEHFVEAMRQPGFGHPGVRPESFDLPGRPAPRGPAGLDSAMATAYELLVEQWDAIHAEIHAMDIGAMRRRWLRHVLELLDFEPVFQRGDTVLHPGGRDELRFDLSTRGWDADKGPMGGLPAPAIHSVAPGQGLDSRSGPGQRGPKGKSPHDMVQLYLNVSSTDRWAIVTNGLALRLLRDYHHTSVRGYVEFDLESLFESRNYGDFLALYRMVHASRFLPRAVEDGERKVEGEGGRVESDEGSVVEADEELSGELDSSDPSLRPPPSTLHTPPSLLLERFYLDSQTTGIRVGEDLRGQVRLAIETLANGFLDGPLLGRLQTEPALTPAFYSELLHVVYRILFLLYAEQRGLLPRHDAPLADLYRETYSITALRERALSTAVPEADPHADLWEGLKVTFTMMAAGAEALGVYAFNGMLFDPGQTPNLLPQPLPLGRGGEPEGTVLCRNAVLLRAIRALTTVAREGSLQRISYADLGVEELGSVYESLLDYSPRISAAAETVEGRTIPANTFFLDPRGAERKTTGSHYTPTSLVEALIRSALLPVARSRLAEVGLPVAASTAESQTTTGLFDDPASLSDAQRRAGEAAILGITVCDSAMGSGHFLVAATNTLALELARLRTSDSYPSHEIVQAARQDVLTHCIYGVDLNPMAVELAKVSLWINAAAAGRPLSFLNHHLQCGNSLLGAPIEIEALDPGAWTIPNDAFKGVTGDDPGVAAAVRRRNREDLASWQKHGTVQYGLLRETGPTYAAGDPGLLAFQEVDDLAARAPAQARDRYAEYLESDAYRQRKLVADTWTAAYFWPLTPTAPAAPTQSTFVRLQEGDPDALSDAQRELIDTLAESHRFFNWRLAFPDVFGGKGDTKTGFDVVLGNPPWERIKLQEKEFFGNRADAAAEDIARAGTAAQRKRLIDALPQRDPVLAEAYRDTLRRSEGESHFLRNSGRYPLGGVGDVNTYAVFAELDRGLIAGGGRAGVIVPTGIATDYTYRDFFASLMGSGELASLYDFENRRGIFAGVHRSYKFSLLTLRQPSAEGQGTPAEFAFFLHGVEDLADPERRFHLSADDLALINPNTRTCPVFRTRRDAELTHKLYRAAPVLVNETLTKNAWGVCLATMFHSGAAAHLFRSGAELLAQKGAFIPSGRVVTETASHFPMYEGKMFSQYDHRAASVIHTTNLKRPGQPIELGASEHQDCEHVPTPRFWVESGEVLAFVELEESRHWLLGFKKVTSPTNERTLIASFLPLSAANDSIHLVFLSDAIKVSDTACFLAALNTMVVDYVGRQKLGGVNFNFFVLEQLPLLPPGHYWPAIRDLIVPRVLELTYTAWDIQAFADDLWREAVQEGLGLAGLLEAQWEANAAETGGGHRQAAAPAWVEPAADGFPYPPFKWDEARRSRLRAELDGLYAHLYGLSADELAYILDTFPIVRRKDEARYGEYRTKRMVLEAFEAVRQVLPEPGSS